MKAAPCSCRVKISLIDELRRLSTTSRFSSPGTPKIRSTPSFSSAATNKSDPLAISASLPFEFNSRQTPPHAWTAPVVFSSDPAVAFQIAMLSRIRHPKRRDEGDERHRSDVPEEYRFISRRLQRQRNIFCGSAEHRVGDGVGKPHPQRAYLGRKQFGLHDAADRGVEARNHEADHDQAENDVDVGRA